MAYFEKMQRLLITIVETVPFLRQAASLWKEDERRAFVDFIAANPEAGAVIPDTGGVRKIRWSRPGTGKRSGVRVIYFTTMRPCRSISCRSTPKHSGRTGRRTKRNGCEPWSPKSSKNTGGGRP